MKRLTLALLIMALPFVVVAATIDAFQVTIDSTAGGVYFPAAKLNAQPAIAYIQCTLRTAEISYSFADPANQTVSSSVGTLLEIGQQVVFNTTQEREMRNFRAIRTTGSSGQLDCTIAYK